MSNKSYGGKWITVAGRAAFQHYFLRIISCFIFVLSEVQGDKTILISLFHNFPQCSAHVFVAWVPTTVTAAPDFFQKSLRFTNFPKKQKICVITSKQKHLTLFHTFSRLNMTHTPWFSLTGKLSICVRAPVGKTQVTRRWSPVRNLKSFPLS